MRQIDVLFEGNNEKIKGIEDAIEITNGLNRAWLGRETKHVPDCQLFTNPPQDEIPKIYRRAKILLKTSKSEGFSLPIIEGMASGCVVVCYDMGGNMDFCKDRHNCRIVTRETAAEVIKELLNDPEQMSILQFRGKETAKEYTWDKVITKWIEFLTLKK